VHPTGATCASDRCIRPAHPIDATDLRIRSMQPTCASDRCNRRIHWRDLRIRPVQPTGASDLRIRLV
jgi:hypothetical protein